GSRAGTPAEASERLRGTSKHSGADRRRVPGCDAATRAAEAENIAKRTCLALHRPAPGGTRPEALTTLAVRLQRAAVATAAWPGSPPQPVPAAGSRTLRRAR